MSDANVEELGRLPNGATLFRKVNEVGGHVYFSDEVGGGVHVWDTCLVAQSTLLFAMAKEEERRYIACFAKRKKDRESNVAS